MENFMHAFKAYAETLPNKAWYSAAILTPGKRPLSVGNFYAHRCQNLYSVTKTFTATAIGLLYDRSLVHPEEKLLDILSGEFTKEAVKDPRWWDVTVHHLLTHSAGLPGAHLDIDCFPYASFGNDFLAFCLATPLTFTPGSGFTYSDGAYYLLSRIVSRRSGTTLPVFLGKELLLPWEYQEAAWSFCPQGHAMGATGLYATSEDVVKLGELYLDKQGLYNRGQLSREWVEMALTKGYGFDEFNSNGLSGKGGMNGQTLLIDRADNVVFCYESHKGPCGEAADWARAHFCDLKN